jgi:predicted secreted Zn-dependent protease
MLLWEVINDGEAYKDRNDAHILPDMMQRLRENGEVGSLAYDVCLSKIRKRHVEEHGNIRRVVLEALQDALRADPLARPSALALLSRLQKSLPDEK